MPTGDYEKYRAHLRENGDFPNAAQLRNPTPAAKTVTPHDKRCGCSDPNCGK